jgi:hypothetical protein
VHFSAHQPKVAGSTLTQNEKRAIMKELQRKKQAVGIETFKITLNLVFNFGSKFTRIYSVEKTDSLG